MNIFFDLETLPTNRPEVITKLLKKIKPPANYKKQETIDKWMASSYVDAMNEATAKTALSGTFGTILAIGFAIDDGEINCLYSDGDEKSLLEQFFAIISDALESDFGSRPHTKINWIGHNIGGFDLRFLHHRMIVNQVTAPIRIPYDDRPYSGSYFDTMYEWAGWGKFISQDDLCLALGLQTKNGMTGADVWDYWKNDRHDEIIEYCKDDVKAVRAIHNKLTY